MGAWIWGLTGSQSLGVETVVVGAKAYKTNMQALDATLPQTDSGDLEKAAVYQAPLVRLHVRLVK